MSSRWASAKRTRSSTRAPSGIGNPVIYVGAKTGRDGIHGASMASAEFTEESKQKRPNVQVGDPFLEKLLLEACLEAMKTGAIVAIQDMGAAGLTSSIMRDGQPRRRGNRYRSRSRSAARNGHDAPTRCCFRNPRSACCWLPKRAGKTRSFGSFESGASTLSPSAW